MVALRLASAIQRTEEESEHVLVLFLQRLLMLISTARRLLYFNYSEMFFKIQQSENKSIIFPDDKQISGVARVGSQWELFYRTGTGQSASKSHTLPMTLRKRTSLLEEKL